MSCLKRGGTSWSRHDTKCQCLARRIEMKKQRMKKQRMKQNHKGKYRMRRREKMEEEAEDQLDNKWQISAKVPQPNNIHLQQQVLNRERAKENGGLAQCRISADVDAMVKVFPHHLAFLFSGETTSFYCMKGKVGLGNMSPLPTPQFI